MTFASREDEVGDTWTSKVDAFASDELTSTGNRMGRALFLQTYACWNTLSCLNCSWLSTIIPITKQNKAKKLNNADITRKCTSVFLQNQILIKYESALPFFLKLWKMSKWQKTHGTQKWQKTHVSINYLIMSVTIYIVMCLKQSNVLI